MDFPRKVYAIQHNVTERIYIGSSRKVKDRYMNHMYRETELFGENDDE